VSIRKLASIQKILDIQPIKDADAIECATINSWKVVVKKGEFNVGNLVVYCEVDSWIPHTIAPFLSKGKTPRVYEGIEGEVLRTVRLRGQISQGLILPVNEMSLIKDVVSVQVNENVYYNGIKVEEGADVSSVLGIIKYEPPVSANLAGVVKGSWPSSIPKTDEERIQNLTNEWSQLSQYTYEVTEKLEGSSMTVGMVDGEFIVCSRNLNLKETEGNTLWAMARKYDIEAKMRAEGFINIAVQGEVIGEGVQGNHYGIKGQDFYVFAIYESQQGQYSPPDVRRKVCELLGLKHVPVVAERRDLGKDLNLDIDLVLRMSDGKSAINPNVLREGLVYKRVDGQEHWKAVSNEYLLKHG
jgi:RNA ligase (TIGR02306 family)